MISIIIVNYNVRQDLIQCLNSITNSIINDKYEIIIIDNNSDISIQDLESKQIKILHMKKNVGFSIAVNIGISESRGELCLLLNPDTRVNSNTISILSKYIKNNLNVGAVGCKVLNPDGSYQLSSRRRFPNFLILLTLFFKLNIIFPKSKYFGLYNYTNIENEKLMNVDSISGSCMMFKKSVYKHVGRFDENYFLYFEDTDFCLQLKQHNYDIIYNPEAQIVHTKGQSTKFNYLHKKEFYKSLNYFFIKNRIVLDCNFILTSFITFICNIIMIYFYINIKYLRVMK